MENKLFSPIVHFISGKGGVGKSLCSKALAAYFARQGYNTLLVELSEEESEAEVPQSFEEIEKNLKFLRLYPDQALYEYLSLKIPGKNMLKKVFGKNFFRALCSAMPGLFDLIRLGKIWFHADPIHSSAKENFEKIVVDLPSSGFIVRFLSIARVVRQVVQIGPLAKEAQLMEDFFKDERNALLHLVTIAQDLVINETSEIYQTIKASSDIHLGMLWINRLSVFKKAELQQLLNKLDTSYPATKTIVKLFLTQSESEEEQLKKIEALGLMLPRMDFKEYFCAHESEIIDEFVKELTKKV